MSDVPSPTASAQPSPATVLVVDDDPLNRQLLSMSIGRLGHDVIEAGNGLEAIETLGQHSVDVVLTDIEMPEMDGYGLLQHRQSDDRLKAIPFIVISGVDEMASIIQWCLCHRASKRTRCPAIRHCLLRARMSQIETAPKASCARRMAKSRD